ncbi:MAG: flagellar export chaperone FliS [Thermodesulfobacteriota bacterium]
MYTNGIQSYRKTNVLTADPKRLVLMCYEGMIDSLNLAKQKIGEKDYEAKGKALVKAQDILQELMNSLDFDKGGSIARSLDSLYNYMLRRMLHANLEKDIGAIDEVVEMLSTLKSAWEEIFSRKQSRVNGEPATLDNQARNQIPAYGPF